MIAAMSVDITVPPILKRRGRPKGHELTVIGLLTKKKKGSVAKHKLQPFLKLHTSKRERYANWMLDNNYAIVLVFLSVIAMLKWFVSGEVRDKAIKYPSSLIEEEHVEVRPEQLTDAVIFWATDESILRKTTRHQGHNRQFCPGWYKVIPG